MKKHKLKKVLKKISSLSNNEKKLLLEYHSLLKVDTMLEINDIKERVLIKLKRNKKVNLLTNNDLLILAMYIYNEFNIELYLQSDKKYKFKEDNNARKMKSLYFHKKWILLMRQYYSLEKLSLLLWQKTNINVSASYLNKFIKEQKYMSKY